ncbi:hypothetical protein CEXT_609001 [Caerostris extrusa]|uniref:Uncharacterized protein n=1 Tax=Caerostris extrusa TaxID=172846 RepID=A0AAV4WQ68_CAEEX|nr:hypothetical protein CEXT_609001 [Caerostris extrusa]
MPGCSSGIYEKNIYTHQINKQKTKDFQLSSDRALNKIAFFEHPQGRVGFSICAMECSNKQTEKYRNPGFFPVVFTCGFSEERRHLSPESSGKSRLCISRTLIIWKGR